MNNSDFIAVEMDWLLKVIIARMNLYFKTGTSADGVGIPEPPQSEGAEGAYPGLIREYGLSRDDRVCLALAAAPLLRPQIMDCFNVKNTNTDQRFSEFGCVASEDGGSIKPTLATVLFVLAGDDIPERIRFAAHFRHHSLFRSPLFDTPSVKGDFNYVLSLSGEFVSAYILEQPYRPEMNSGFPARLVTTSRSWSDLVLEKETLDGINEIKLWLEYGKTLLKDWKLEGKVKNGYRALFYGPSGTGKTFTASLLGKATGRDVYCVDLSLTVSKYIGETEKNLSNIFSQAENRDWILFFDEADALFGKRTNIKDSHDRYANQEIAYLLQRIEDYSGLVVLSTNLKTNIDEAFARRFQSVVRFRMPTPELRAELWKNSFSTRSVLHPSIDIDAISEEYEMTGASIMNVVQFCSLRSLARGSDEIVPDDLLEGIRREYSKEGRII